MEEDVGPETGLGQGTGVDWLEPPCGCSAWHIVRLLRDHCVGLVLKSLSRKVTLFHFHHPCPFISFFRRFSIIYFNILRFFFFSSSILSHCQNTFIHSSTRQLTHSLSTSFPRSLID